MSFSLTRLTQTGYVLGLSVVVSLLLSSTPSKGQYRGHFMPPMPMILPVQNMMTDVVRMSGMGGMMGMGGVMMGGMMGMMGMRGGMMGMMGMRGGMMGMMGMSGGMMGMMGMMMGGM